LPLPDHLTEFIETRSSPAHVGKLRNAIDFIVPLDTPVLAAAEGTVTYVKDDSFVGGPDPLYWMNTNFITIMHPNGEYTRYDHLAYHSSKVRVGDHIIAGQQIANVGMTGYTYIAHLHFQVFVFIGLNIWTDFDTIEVTDFVE